MTCPGESELAQALTSGGDPEVGAHVAGCGACREAWDGTMQAIELARELPVALPSSERREEMRTALLAAATGVSSRPARRPWIAPVLAAVAAAGVIAALEIPRSRASQSPVRRAKGVVHPRPGARYLVGSIGADEIVDLTDGVIDVEVEPLRAGERFRVVVGGAEIEVRGTAFRVAASRAHLVDVAVSRGRVDVRPETGAPAVLGSGQSWHVSAAEPPAPAVVLANPLPVHPAPRPVAARAQRIATLAPLHADAPPLHADPPPPPVAAPAPVTPPARAPEEIAYDAAWEALRAEDFARAASGFSRVLSLAPDGPLVEDASFWRAVTLARSKRSAEALAGFRDFLDVFARSARAGEASAMLGWILIDAHAYDEAGRRFRAAVGDPSPAVRGSAQAGLDALAKRKR